MDAPCTVQSPAAPARGRQAAASPTPAGASLSERAQDKPLVSPETSQQLLGVLSFSPPPTCQQADPNTASLICYVIFGSPQTHTDADTRPPLNWLFLTMELVSSSGSSGKRWREEVEGEEWLQHVSEVALG